MHHAKSANNSQNCWANNVVTRCVRLYAPRNKCKQAPITPNIVGLTMLWLVAFVCMHHATSTSKRQQLPTLLGWQCCDLMRSFACTTQQAPTTPNIVGLTMLWLVAFVCMHHATSANNSQHCWANNVGQTMLWLIASVCMNLVKAHANGRNMSQHYWAQQCSCWRLLALVAWCMQTNATTANIVGVSSLFGPY